MPTTKRRVTMTTYTTLVSDGDIEVQRHEAVDYVPADILDAYVADARTKWQAVAISDEFDDGPAGPEGNTTIPDFLQGA